MEYRRIGWIDDLKGICILCVMLSHLQSAAHIPLWVYEPFFLTGFLFAAGYVHRQAGFSVFFRKKLRGLLVPWLVFSVGNILLSQVITFQPHGPLWQELKWNFLQIRGQGDGVWFVAALFAAFFPFRFLLARHHRWGDAGLCLITFGLSCLSMLYTRLGLRALPWHLEYLFQPVFFMTVGWVSRRRELRPRGLWAGAAWGLLLLPVLMNWPMPPLAAVVHSHALSLAAVFALTQLCRRLPRIPVLQELGRNSLVCFALHGKVMSLLQWSLGRFFPDLYGRALGVPGLSAVLAFALTGVMAAALLLPIRIIDRWFPFLLGRERRTS